MQRQVDPRVARPEGLDHCRQDAVARRADEAHGQRARLAARRLPGRAHGAVDLRQNRPRLGQKHLARAGELYTPLRALEQQHPQLGFELANLAAQRGLRDVQARGRATEVQCLGHGDEVA